MSVANETKDAYCVIDTPEWVIYHAMGEWRLHTKLSQRTIHFNGTWLYYA